MKKEKLSLSGIKNVLSRAELKKIMAGGSSGECSFCGPGGYNYCGCYDATTNELVLTLAACGNGDCNTWCIAELGYVNRYGKQLPCPF